MRKNWLKVVTVLVVMFGLLGGPQAIAADPPKTAVNPTIKGTMDIKFNTRVQCDDAGKPEKGVKDVYTVDLTVNDSIIYQGKIERTPIILGDYLSTVRQEPLMDYFLKVFVKTPTGPSILGDLNGYVPMNRKGEYLYDKGKLKLHITRAGGTSGSYSGLVVGKPPKDKSLLARSKKQVVSIKKMVNGKTYEMKMDDYDPMDYRGLTIASGPFGVYPEVKFDGTAIYDYRLSAWYFNGIKATYIPLKETKSVTDTLTGNIRWDDKGGYYEFDIRVNEPTLQSGDESTMKNIADDEAAFFAIDSNFPGLIGKMTYKDDKRGDAVVASKVTIDLVGNKLTKTQTMYLAQMTMLANVGPMNDE